MPNDQDDEPGLGSWSCRGVPHSIYCAAIDVLDIDDARSTLNSHRHAQAKIRPSTVVDRARMSGRHSHIEGPIEFYRYTLLGIPTRVVVGGRDGQGIEGVLTRWRHGNKVV